MSMPRRDNADIELCKMINAAMTEFHMLLSRIKRGSFPTDMDIELMEEAKRLLEEASGRLVLRQHEGAE